MEYLNFKNLLHKRKYRESEEKYENQLCKKGRKNVDPEAENDFMVKSILISIEVLQHAKNRKKITQTKIDLQVSYGGTKYTTNGMTETSKNKMRLKQETINVILKKISPQSELTATNPLSTNWQLALIIYRLAPGFSFSIVEDFLDVSVSSPSTIFNKAC